MTMMLRTCVVAGTLLLSARCSEDVRFPVSAPSPSKPREFEPSHSLPPVGVFQGWTRCPETDAPVQVGGVVKAPVSADRPSHRDAIDAYDHNRAAIVQVVIGADGVVKEARALKAPNATAAACAEERVKQWLFVPGGPS